MKSKAKTIFLILLLFSIISMLLIWVQEVPDNIIPDDVLSPQTGQNPITTEDKESSEKETTNGNNIKLPENDQESVSPIPTEENKSSEKSSYLGTAELITSSTSLIESTSMSIPNSTLAITDNATVSSNISSTITDDATASSNISSTITKTNQTNQSDSDALIVITATADYSKDTNVPTVQ